MKYAKRGEVVYFWIPYREHPYEKVLLMKIGKTTNVANRMKQIQSTSPIECSSVWILHGDHDYSDLERRVHEYFASDRQHGEWFKISPYDWKCFQEDHSKMFPSSKMEKVYSDPRAYPYPVEQNEQAA